MHFTITKELIITNMINENLEKEIDNKFEDKSYTNFLFTFLIMHSI